VALMWRVVERMHVGHHGGAVTCDDVLHELRAELSQVEAAWPTLRRDGRAVPVVTCDYMTNWQPPPCWSLLH
jgi:hypothetical protein